MLSRYSAAMIAAGTLPPHRVAMLAPGPRDEWYSASALYSRALYVDVIPALPAAGPPVGMGASLGALAMLVTQRRAPGTFGGLFLQSGSFFMPRFDAHESGFPRYARIVRVVRRILRALEHPDPVPVQLTCGAAEENVLNNRVMARALAEQGYAARLDEVPDMHNYTGWRDAFDPHLTRLLQAVWR
jgi:enterochelin esterase-like enzyme